LTLPVVFIVVIVWELDLQLPMQVVPITTDVVSSNLDEGGELGRDEKFILCSDDNELTLFRNLQKKLLVYMESDTLQTHYSLSRGFPYPPPRLSMSRSMCLSP
jgi:hypothetical protein